MKRIVVLGAGESGAGAAVLAKVKGFDTFVSDMSAIKDKYKTLLDGHGIAWEEGRHTEEQILSADEVVKSPGIPNDAPLILKLREQGTYHLGNRICRQIHRCQNDLYHRLERKDDHNLAYLSHF